MIRRSVKLQLLAFMLITLVTVAILSARYVGLGDRLLGGTYLVTADFAQSGGIFVGSEVTYRGVRVGRVERLRLDPTGVLVDARLDRGTQVPRDTVAVVENRSAVGEQYLDLQPRRQGGPFLRAGDVIPRASTRYPLRVDQLLQDFDDTVQSVDKKRLKAVTDELGLAFADGGHDLQRLLDSSDALTRSATEALPETVKLIDDGRLVLETQRRGSRQLVDFSTSFADIAETLKGSDGDLRVILDRGAIASRELDALIRENRGPLAALLANLITVGQVTTARVDGIQQLLVTYPDVVAGGFTVVPGDGTAHFGLALANEPPVCTKGYEGTRKTAPSQVTNLPPLNRAARCTLPRGSASSVRGAQNAPGPSSGTSSAVPQAVTSPGAASFSFAAEGQPLPLGNTELAAALTGSDLPSILIPVPPPGAKGANQWLWMMQASAQ
jgi:phospholipid/cholesterol/gamma-HCH transport system substrate-binding protein